MRVTGEKIYTIELTEIEAQHLLGHLEDDFEVCGTDYITAPRGQSVLGFSQALLNATRIK